MPRIKLVPRDNYQHVCRTTVRVTDLNYGKHLGNDALLGLVHEARVNFFRDLGVSEGNLGDGNTGVIMTDTVISYKGEGQLFDQLLIESSIDEIQTTSFRMFHRISTPQKLIALVEAGLIPYDYARAKVSRLPEEFYKQLASYLKSETQELV